ncbi:MAG: bifunctional riboflavin kinase/FAD synthetase [Acidobacteriales bacterium]|nr:bifunctional riboflavin kinase/FAD synthetase [Terriglobales bacterium]
MRIFRHLEEIPAGFGPSVASVGNFDGVHRAHRSVLGQVVERARQLQAKAVAVTFDPHPARILRPESAPRLITPLPVKIKLLQQDGLDALLILPFSRDLSLTPPRDFARTVLAEMLRAREVHEGYNFHFGHKAEGNVQRLAEFGKEFGFEVRVYKEMRLRGCPVSSSSIRKLLVAGNVATAHHLLDRSFSIIAHPGRGRGYGHKYTVPTINLERYDELVPGNGVYVTRTRVGGETFDSVTNIGNRPTFGEESFAIESHLLNFREISLTADTEVEVSFLKYLRPEQKWPDVDALRAQIALDVRRARRYFHLLRVFSTPD